MERRSFIKTCALICAGGTAVSMLLSSCKSVYYATAVVDNKTITLKKTEFTNEEGVLRAFVVVRNDRLEFPICIYRFDKTYIALSTKCTHSGCEVQPNATTLVCPCHGSEFSNKGKVMNPPAESDLKQYIVTEDNENILVQL
ncbi:MAG TPA: Rieske (2Fe-2S) protein [Bacteroidia bacterium]|nr:Rieske (2Fe-2S) protein [Bacteroidia bacterium]